MMQKKSKLIRYAGQKFDDAWFMVVCIVYTLWWPVLGLIAVVALAAIALSMTGCNERPTMTAAECGTICTDAVHEVAESNLRDCQNAIAAVRATCAYRTPARQSTDTQLCAVITPDDCAHNRDLCPKVGTRVCHEEDNRSDCEHDVDLCPGRK